MSGIQLHIASISEEEKPKPKKINEESQQAPQQSGKKNKKKKKKVEVEKQGEIIEKKKKDFQAKTYQSYIDSSVKSTTNEEEKVEEEENKEEPEEEEFSTENSQTTTFSKGFIDDLNLYQHLKDRLKNMGIEQLTRIQQGSYDPIKNTMKDVLMKSETGSGKTLAYVIPMIQKLYEYSLKHPIKREKGTYAIIISPTRELCIQIQQVIEKVTQKIPFLITGTTMGGEKKKSEKSRIKKGITILISTPGRLYDHLCNTSCFVYDELQFLIMDEADRLLDMGFEKQLNEIFEILKKKWEVTSKRPQVLLSSATLNTNVVRLTEMGLKNPLKVGFGDSEDSYVKQKDIFTVPKNLQQFCVIAPLKLRLVILIAFLRSKTIQTEINNHSSKIITFFSCCNSVNFHYSLFNSARLNDYESEGEPLFDVELFKLHGDMEQKERTKIYFDFLKAKSGILLCTDVAARGLDLPLVDWIIQYDAPGEPKEYLHRVGRTARLDKKGNALLFLQPHEDLYKNLLEKLKLNIIDLSGEQILENLVTTFKRKTEEPMEAANIMQAICEQTIEKDEALQKLSMDALDSHMKAYTTHSRNTKYIFHIKNLHQGHLAKSFALKETPTNIRKKFKPEVEKEIFDEKKRKKKLSATEKLQKYKDFQTGRLPMRPKIDMPDNFKRQRDSGNELIKFKGTSNSSFSRKAAYETMSEFSSGMPSSKKRKL